MSNTKSTLSLLPFLQLKYIQILKLKSTYSGHFWTVYGGNSGSITMYGGRKSKKMVVFTFIWLPTNGWIGWNYGIRGTINAKSWVIYLGSSKNMVILVQTAQMLDQPRKSRKLGHTYRSTWRRELKVAMGLAGVW